MNKRYYVPRWIATQIYRPAGHPAVRAVISNEFDHELVTLDDDSAEVWWAVWQAGAEGIAASALQACFPSLSTEDIEGFVGELAGANLLTTAADALPLRRSEAPEPSPGASRYSEGHYVEPPMAGGDNLEEEFEFQDWAREHGFLWSTSWEMTYRCNESCVHCFNPGASHGPERAHRKTDELTLPEARQLLADMRQLGVFRLLLTGGEVMLRKDFFDILDEARRRGLSVTVFTNGTLLDDAAIDRLADAFPHRVELTLYATREKHDDITRLKGSFDKTVAAARELVARGVTVAIKTTVMRDTAFDHHALRRLCDDIGCEYMPDFNMSAGVDGARAPLTRLSPNAEDLIRNALDPATPVWVGTLEQPRRIDLDAVRGQPVCGAGRSLMSISPEGHITPCNSLPIFMGSVREGGLPAVWNAGRFARAARGESDAGQGSPDELSRWQGVVRGKYKVCGDFRRCAWCQKCPGMAYLETGDELAPSVSNCRVAAARMIGFDLLGAGVAAQPLDMARLRADYAGETALWADETVEQRVSLDAVKRVLRERTKATALLQPAEDRAGTGSRS